MSIRLRIDPTACDGLGVCAHLAPTIVTVDDWGFPILPSGELTPAQERSARRAVAGCPRRALFLDPVPQWHPLRPARP